MVESASASAGEDTGPVMLKGSLVCLNCDSHRAVCKCRLHVVCSGGETTANPAPTRHSTALNGYHTATDRFAISLLGSVAVAGFCRNGCALGIGVSNANVTSIACKVIGITIHELLLRHCNQRTAGIFPG